MTRACCRVLFHLFAVLGIGGANLITGGVEAAQTAPVFAVVLQQQRVTLPASPTQGYKQTISCTRYPEYMIRQVRDGDDMGNASISVVPGSRPVCSGVRSPSGKDLADNAHRALIGASCRFILLGSADTYSGGRSVAIFDAKTGRKLHTDFVTAYTLFRPSADGNTLELKFSRVVVAPCSLASKQSDCWARTVRIAKLPPEVARRTAPGEICAAAYAAKNMTSEQELADPSVISFDVTMTMTRAGSAATLSSAALSCWPAA